MLLLGFTLRHLLRHWRLNLAILAGLTLAAALLAGLPAYAGTIAERSLHEKLSSHAFPVVRNIGMSASEGGVLDDQVYTFAHDRLGPIITDRITIGQIKQPVHQPPAPGDQVPPPPRFHFLHLWSFNELERKVRVIEGRLPVYEDVIDGGDVLPSAALEVAVGADAAARTDLRVGEVVTASTPVGRIPLYIVGTVEPLDFRHDMWWDDPRTFSIEVKLIGRSKVIVTLPLLLPPQAMTRWFPEHTPSWRILVDSDKITVQNAAEVQRKLTNLQAQLRNDRILLESGLPNVLVDFEIELATARWALFLLSAQAFAFVLYTLWMITFFLLDRSEGELVTLAGRGGGRLQITLVFALEGLFLALPAAGLFGPLLAGTAVRLWRGLTGTTVTFALPAESWALAFLAAGAGWLALVLAVHTAARRTLREWQHRLVRPERQAGWQRLYLDLVLLFLGGLLCWQLSQSGSFLLRQTGSSRIADPFLLLGSSVLLFAVALVCLRIFPYLLRLAAWIARQGRGLVSSSGLTRLARAPLAPSRVVLLVSLATSLTLFTDAFTSSLGKSQQEAAHYLAGADLRIRSDRATGDAAEEGVDSLPGVLVASAVYRTRFMNQQSRMVDVLAIDPESFAQVARYRPDMGHPDISSLMQILQQEALSGTLPGIVSPAMMDSEQAIGSLVPAGLRGRELRFEVKAVVGDFPTLGERFIVTDLRLLAGQSALEAAEMATETWLATDPAQHAALTTDPLLRDRILADAQLELRRLQSDAMAQGTTGAFQLNTLVLGVLSVVGFLLVHYFAAQKRSYEFSLLRTMGLTPGQLLALLATEGILMVGLGLLVGTGIGYGLTRFMLPYLSRALATSLAGIQIHQLVINWAAVLQLYGILVGGYVLALIAVLVATMRAGLYRILRLGEE